MGGSTAGDVKADVDRALRGLDSKPLGDLGPLVERIQKLAAFHPALMHEALERLRCRIPAALLPPARPAPEVLPYRMMEQRLSPQSLPPLLDPRIDLWRFANVTMPREMCDIAPCDLAFDEEIPAGKSTLVARPQILFRGELLIIPNEECAVGDLLEIAVARRAQAQANPGPRPLALYCPARWSEPKLMDKAKLRVDTATPGMEVSLTVSVNRPMRFQAVLRGVGAR